MIAASMISAVKISNESSRIDSAVVSWRRTNDDASAAEADTSDLPET
jgi:hypothetical protein